MANLRVDILTLFPEMFDAVLNSSIIGRAVENGILEINCVQIRDFAFNKHRQVDDYPYGGGQGMVMQAEPIYLAYMSVCEGLSYKPKTIYLSPQGKTFRQSTAKRLSKEKHLVLICGHYEGVDQRVLDEIVDMEISIGDFVLTGGEIGAMAVVDATVCLLLKPAFQTSRTTADFWSIPNIQGLLCGTKEKFLRFCSAEITSLLRSGNAFRLSKIPLKSEREC